MDKAAKQTTAQTLLVQKEQSAINLRMRELRADQPGLNQMAAWNMAASEAMETLRTINPEELMRLQKIAADTCASKALDYTECSKEDLDRWVSYLV